MSQPRIADQPSATGGIQSVARAFGLLEILADVDSGLMISELAEKSGLPIPTAHRLLQTVIRLGYARQLLSRRYALGAGLIKLGEQARAQVGVYAERELSALAQSLGETANLAILDRYAAVYVAQSPSPHPMRMFTEVGHRVALHDTGVGKAILATLPDEAIELILERTGIATPTVYSHATLEAVLADVRRIRVRGYAIDDQEQELGVRCYAVAVPNAFVPMAVSVSGPLIRIGDDFGGRAVRLLKDAALRIGR